MWFIILSLAHKGFEFIINTAGFSRVPGSGLKSDGGRTVRRQFKVEGISIRAQLFDQPLLKLIKISWER